MLKLIASDMDGTFLDDAMGYDRVRFAAVHERMAALGIRFVVASGNQYFQLRSFFPDHPDTLYVAENGAYIADSEGELLVRPLAKDAATATWRSLARWPDLHVVVCGRRSAYTLSGADAGFVARMGRYFHRLAPVESFEDIADDVCKVTVACTPEHTGRLVVALRDELADGGVVPVSGGNGAIDLIVDRRKMRATLASLIAILTGRPSPVLPPAANGPAGESPPPPAGEAAAPAA